MDQSYEGIIYEEEFIYSRRGLKLFTCRWLPEKREPTALIFLCHGYAMECSVSMKDTAARLVKAGNAVYGMDYEGHGKSDGLQGFVPSFEALVSDCSDFYMAVCERPNNLKKQRFLLGESMGGAVAILLHRKAPIYWNGAILIAPMCKIADEMKPHPLIINILTKLTKCIPTWRIIPNQDIIDVAFKSERKREEIRSNPLCYKGKLRLKTAHELLMVSVDIEKSLDTVSLPFLIVHGGDDVVTDPRTSRLLYERAASKDKTFKIYPGMWHALTSAEPLENIDLVFSYIISWLAERTIIADDISGFEHKLTCDKSSNVMEGKEI